MKRTALFGILWVAKWTGVFALCRRLTRRDLRILCYHGAELHDESRFRPTLFIDGDTFADRMGYLARKGYSVLRLDDALRQLENGAPKNCPTVITIDDGWYGTYKVMAPILRQHGFPATLYVASYYVDKQVQVFNVALGYVLWRTGRGVLELSQVGDGLSGEYDLAKPTERDDAFGRLNEFAEELPGASERQDLLRRVCECVGFDWRSMESKRLLSFMNEAEAGKLKDQDIDLQLHTHRHRFTGLCSDGLKREIEDNRAALSRIAESKPRHFCFPSGEYQKEQLTHLRDLDISSAVTVRPGFVRKGHPVYELTRFLDSPAISDLEFEAEMTGFFEVVRRLGYAI